MMDGKAVRNMQSVTQNKFETLMHLVGFTIEIYYDTRPYERQIRTSTLFFSEGINISNISNISKSVIRDKPYYRSTLYCKKYREDRRRCWYLVI